MQPQPTDFPHKRSTQEALEVSEPNNQYGLQSQHQHSPPLLQSGVAIGAPTVSEAAEAEDRGILQGDPFESIRRLSRGITEYVSGHEDIEKDNTKDASGTKIPKAESPQNSERKAASLAVGLTDLPNGIFTSNMSGGYTNMLKRCLLTSSHTCLHSH